MTHFSSFQFDSITVDDQGKIVQRKNLTNQYYLEALADGVALAMVLVPDGSFLMGSPDTEEGYHSSQSPQHQVNISQFFMSRYPITKLQWQAVVALPKVARSLDPDCSNFTTDHNQPVEQVTWYDAVEFCQRLAQFTGKPYRLPSEAEWEYACRAQTQTPFHVGETITTEIANYSGVDWEYLGKVCSKGSYGSGPLGSDRRETTPVGSLKRYNDFGLGDMHGNVREWCADPWHRNYVNAPTDGRVWLENGDESKRVIRGGSWNRSPQKCRSAYRDRFDPNASLYDIGFRVVCQF
ncbi:MAG: formylglycine-generating enzyme family protein [Snowella sp.]|nr:formylglycine-generating enzyme family protein [Snowella sp.]